MTYDKASFLAGLRTGLALPRISRSRWKPYLTFMSEDSSEFTLSLHGGREGKNKTWNGTLFYSTDTINWTEWKGSLPYASAYDLPTLNSDNGVLYLRGVGNTRICSVWDYRLSIWVIKPDTARIHCLGNIETLLDYNMVTAGEHPPMTDYCFKGVLSYNQALKTPPALPSPVICLRCYTSLFAGSGIERLPELPALDISVDYECYDSMFWGCSSVPLRETPDEVYKYEYRIPPKGTTINPAYGNMFHMFDNTGSIFRSALTVSGSMTPYVNRTYYTTQPPVPA